MISTYLQCWNRCDCAGQYLAMLIFSFYPLIAVGVVWFAGRRK